MKYSGIGGQAVMEGVMMKNKDRYAVAVRKPDHTIELKVEDYNGIVKNEKIKNLPFVRGVINFVESLTLGMGTLTYSASFFEEEEEDKKQEEKKKGNEDLMMKGTVVVSILLSILIFFCIPHVISSFLGKFIAKDWLLSLLEGVIRLTIFVLYILLISLMEDIQRVFMYHGAEHKCINCIEHGLELTVENVRMSSKRHKRCGTSFLIIVMLVSMILFMFVRFDSGLVKLGVKLLLIPVIAGISYEFIRLAGRYENWFTNLISIPGMWMQNLTTKEPDDDMIEVGIASVEAVFDWKKWQEEQM